MLCFKCLKTVPDRVARCPNCGQTFTGKNAPQPSGDRGPVLQEGQKVGHFEIRGLVGEGPIGRVYKVLDTQFDIIAALKILHPELARDRAVRNTTLNVFRSLSEFDADGFVKIYDAGEDGDKVYISTDYQEGLSLRRLMEVRAGGKFGWDEAEPIFDAVLSVLETMNPGEVHGDLKPENILILPDAVRLTDFGLARITPPADFVASQVFGGNLYLAPELAADPDRLLHDPAVDVYAAGAILYQLLSGNAPGDTASVKFDGIVPEVAAVLQKALQADPDLRYAHVAEMHLVLAHLAKKNDVAARVEILLHDLPPRPVYKTVETKPPKVAPKPPAEAPAQPAVPVKPKSLFDDDLLNDKPAAVSAPLPSVVTSGARQEKSKIPLFAGLGAAVLLVVGAIGYFASRPTEHVQTETPAAAIVKPAPTHAPVAAPVPTAPEPEVDKPDIAAATAVARAEKSRDDSISMDAAKGAPELFVAAMKKLRDAGEALHNKQYAQAVSAASAAEKGFADAIIKGVGARSKGGKDKDANKDVKSVAQSEPAAPPQPVKKEKCPPNTIYIASGSFIMGAPSNDPDRNPGEKNNESVAVSAFCIDKFEFPNQKGSMPAANVLWTDAKNKCESAGKRLCSEEEWERACKGPKNLKFPYSASYDAGKCNTEDAGGNDRKLGASGSQAACVSGYGVQDMSGNLWEWTSSALQANSKDRVLRGGSFTRPDYHDRCANRYNSLPSVTSKEFGFRCCAAANE